MAATKKPASVRAEIVQLARDMLIAGITAGAATGSVVIPEGEATRRFVRSARVFFSEVDTPTKPRKEPAPRRGDDDDYGAADTSGLDDGMLGE